MGLNEKSENRKLYYCDSAHCRVVTFVPSDHDFCPSCNQIGLLIRGPVATRLGLRPTTPNGRTDDAADDPSYAATSSLPASDAPWSVVEDDAADRSHGR